MTSVLSARGGRGSAGSTHYLRCTLVEAGEDRLHAVRADYLLVGGGWMGAAAM